MTMTRVSTYTVKDSGGFAQFTPTFFDSATSTTSVMKYLGSKRSDNYLCNGVSCPTYNYVQPENSNIDEISNRIIYHSAGGKYYWHDTDLAFGLLGYSDSKHYYYPSYVIKFWFSYMGGFFLLCEEADNIDNFYRNHKITYSPQVIKPFQPFDFKCSVTTQKHNIIFNSTGGFCSTTPVTYDTWDKVNEQFEFRGGPALRQTNNCLSVVDVDLQYTSSNWKVSALSFSIAVSDYDIEVYSLRELSNDYNVYAGKEVGSDFLNHFSLVLRVANDYIDNTSVIQSTIKKSSLIKTVFNNSDNNVTFDYKHNGKLINFSSNKKIIHLADESVRYNLLQIKSEYMQGEYFDSSEIDIKNSGFLLYEDGSTLPLSEVQWQASPTVKSTIPSPSYITETCSGFNVTYIMPTTHFGTLSYDFHVNVLGQTGDYISRVDLINQKVNYEVNDILGFPSDCQLLCYNQNNELIKTIVAADLGKNISKYPTFFGSVLPQSLYIDQPIHLSFTYQSYKEFGHDIYLSYYEKKIELDVTNAKQKYFIGSEKYGEKITLDRTNVIAKATHHSNTKARLGVITKYDVSDDVTLTCNEDISVISGSKVYTITASYRVPETNQLLTNTYDIVVARYEPVRIEVTGTSDSLHYWNNDLDTFHQPRNLVFNRVYSDGTIEEITDLSTLSFYRDSSLTTKLEPSSSVIKEKDGSLIYVYDKFHDISGLYAIKFEEDLLVNAQLANEISFVLGNKLSSYRSSMIIQGFYSSGVVKEINTYRFENSDYILEEVPINIIVNETVFTLDSSNITFIHPSISQIVVDTSKFPVTYNNNSDSIDVSSIVLSVKYENADYIEQCEFKNAEIIENDNEYLVSCPKLPAYDFSGSQDLAIDMMESFETLLPLTFSVRNRFDHNNQTNTTISIDIKVVEITDVTGISLKKVFTDYKINELFLKNDDMTEISLYYKTSNGVQKKAQVRLNSGLSAINISPMKGTKLSSLSNNRIVKITSATNSNIGCEYAISVSARHSDSITQTHDIVAIYHGVYKAPNNQYIEGKYLLIDRIDSDGNVNTKINSEGERVLVDNKSISDIRVYGYLDDIFDESKNARVVLFEDYIPPVEGSNNITVKYPSYVAGNAETINKCRFGIFFGNNNAKNRLFVSGNPERANCDWHSGQISSVYSSYDGNINGNFGYFEDTSYCYYGETDNSIVGYDIVSNDKLLVLKNKSDKETTIYFRTPTLLQAIDASGNAMTDLDGQPLYQEEFSLIKGNNSIAGISPKAIINFNGDCLFLTDDKSLVGLDLIGIIGDNQRYANSRSVYIDEDLKRYDMMSAWLWSNNKELLILLKDKLFITNYETKIDNQYEWWVENISDVQAIIDVDQNRYYANSNGQLYRLTTGYDDISKIFVGQGDTLLITEGVKDDEIIVSESVISQMSNELNYRFKIVPTNNEDVSYMYYQIGTVSNVRNGSFDFYVDEERNHLELMCYREDHIDYEEVNKLTNQINEGKPIYINHIAGESEIGALPNSSLKTYYKKYYLRRASSDKESLGNDCYNLVEEGTGTVVDIRELYRCSLCHKLDEEYDIVEINPNNYSFKIKHNDRIVNLVRYANQDIIRSFKAEIKQYKPVEAYYITKPFTMGSLDYFKTIWSWTLTNDSSIPSELEIAVANNKIPFESMRTLATISKDNFSFDLNAVDFRKIDLQKNIVPRTYTSQRILSQLKFVCFGFRNFNNTNSVLSSMSIIYTIPFPSYGGD